MRALALLLLVPVTAWAGPDLGDSAPAFTQTDRHGRAVSLDDFAGQIVVLEWSDPGCPFVKKQYQSGNIQAMQRDAAAAGVVWLSVISGVAANRPPEKRGGTPAALLLDPDARLARLYDARATPEIYIIDKNGILAFKGAIDDKPSAKPKDVAGATNFVRAALADLAAGRPVATPNPRPYGCAVKYPR